MRTMVLGVIMASLVLAAAGCATVLTGMRQTVVFPPARDSGLTVTIANRRGDVIASGLTPLSVDLRRGRRHTATIVRSSGETTTAQLRGTLNGSFLLNAIFWPGIPVDLITGTYGRFKQPSLYDEPSAETAVGPPLNEVRRRVVFLTESQGITVTIFAQDDGMVTVAGRDLFSAAACALRPSEAREWVTAVGQVVARDVQVREGEFAASELPDAPGYCSISGERITTPTQVQYLLTHRSIGAFTTVRSRHSDAGFREFLRAVAAAADSTEAMTSRSRDRR